MQHRFGGALNLNCHVHGAVIDGVFTRDDQNERAVFHASAASAVTETPSIPVVEKPRAIAAEGDRDPDAPRLPVPLGATEAVLDPARLLAAPKRAPFEPGKARYTSGVWRIDWATLLKRVYDVDALACPCGGRLKSPESFELGATVPLHAESDAVEMIHSALASTARSKSLPTTYMPDL